MADTATTAASGLAPYDAVLIESFGGPSNEAEVAAFLHDVTDGRGIPENRLEVVAGHYRRFGGGSPITDENHRLIAALRAELANRGIRTPLLFGNLHWYPRTIDTLRTAAAFGVRRILAVLTSAYASYSGYRQYREHLAGVRAQLAAEGVRLRIDVLRPYCNHPGFVAANVETIRDAFHRLDPTRPSRLIAVTHSIPDTMNRASAATGPSYLEQHREVLRLIEDSLASDNSSQSPARLAFCSRSGAPDSPWLEPDVESVLADLHREGVDQAVIAPIGFIMDHMEVVYDLDTEAREAAERLGMTMVRAATAVRSGEFIRGLAELVQERAARERGEDIAPAVVGDLPAFPDAAPAGSCLQVENIQTGVPVIAGEQA